MSQLKASTSQTYLSNSLIETQQIGERFTADIVMPACVYLLGDLGAGKTTLCKTIIQSLGYTDIVTSPTYNLIQEYPITTGVIYHMDCYRLDSPEELAFLAVPDLWSKESLFLVEWPSKGGQFLPDPTHTIEIKNNELLDNSREIRINKY